MKRETKAVLGGAFTSAIVGFVALAYAEPPSPRTTVEDCARQSTTCAELRACGVGPEVACEHITETEAHARGL